MKTLAPKLIAKRFNRIAVAEPVQPSHSGVVNYGGKWRAARNKFLMQNKYCVYCAKRGIQQPAEVLDHIIPHRGDWKLFWDKTNWQPLCNHCHNTIKAEEERQAGYR